MTQRLAPAYSETHLVILDLDDFGRINKEFDHTVGDLVISRVGDVIKHSLRAEDIGGRLGGDEFAVLLPYTDQVDAAKVVSRLRRSIEALSGHIGRGWRGFVGAGSLQPLSHHAPLKGGRPLP